MSKGNTFESDILKLFFNATAIADLADDDQTAPVAVLVVALHIADPTESGTQASSPPTYTGYTNITVARTTGGWTVSGTAPTVASPVANITFPTATAGTDTITHFSVGTGTSNFLMYSGVVSPNIVVSTGVTPILTTATTIAED